jgi:hypothetical protein
VTRARARVAGARAAPVVLLLGGLFGWGAVSAGGAAVGSAPSDAAAASSGPSDVAGLLPPSSTVPGWLTAGEPRTLPAAELWQQIDGAAEQYISFGCSLLTVGEYKRENGEGELTVEIYTFAEHLGCFGLYALERPAQGPYLDVGAQGYQAGGDLNFLGGRHYFKLRVYPEGPAEIEALGRFARTIAAHFTRVGFPPELGVFPREELVADSFGYVPRAVLGLKGFDRALSARYRHAGGDITLYIVRESSPAAAEASETAVLAALAQRSTGALEEVRIAGSSGVRGDLRYHGQVLLLRSGSDILLAAGALDGESGRGPVERMLAALAGG